MIVYFSNEFRSRNFTPAGRKIKPGYLVVGCGVLFLLGCVCIGLVGGIYYFRPNLSLPTFPTTSASSARPTATPTVNPNKPIPLRSKGLGENGLELTVLKFQRPLKVEGLIGAPPNQQYVLATVKLKNTKNSGAPIAIDPGDFTIKGDGGLVYNANPKNITINNLMTPTTLAPNKELESELIYQIALNDSGLKLYWKAGNTTRTFLLEDEK